MEMSCDCFKFQTFFSSELSNLALVFPCDPKDDRLKKATSGGGGGEEIMWVLTFQKSILGPFLCLSSVSVKFSMDQCPGLLRACFCCCCNSTLYKTWKLTTSQMYSLIQVKAVPKRVL